MSSPPANEPVAGKTATETVNNSPIDAASRRAAVKKACLCLSPAERDNKSFKQMLESSIATCLSKLEGNKSKMTKITEEYLQFLVDMELWNKWGKKCPQLPYENQAHHLQVHSLTRLTHLSVLKKGDGVTNFPFMDSAPEKYGPPYSLSVKEYLAAEKQRKRQEQEDEDERQLQLIVAKQAKALVKQMQQQQRSSPRQSQVPNNNKNGSKLLHPNTQEAWNEEVDLLKKELASVNRKLSTAEKNHKADLAAALDRQKAELTKAFETDKGKQTSSDIERRNKAVQAAKTRGEMLTRHKETIEKLGKTNDELQRANERLRNEQSVAVFRNKELKDKISRLYLRLDQAPTTKIRDSLSDNNRGGGNKVAVAIPPPPNNHRWHRQVDEGIEGVRTVATLKKEVEGLEVENQDLKQVHLDTSQKVSRLEDENKKLKDKVIWLEDKVKNMKPSFLTAPAPGNYNQLGAENKQLKEKIASLEEVVKKNSFATWAVKQVKELQDENKKMEGKVVSLQAELEEKKGVSVTLKRNHDEFQKESVVALEGPGKTNQDEQPTVARPEFTRKRDVDRWFRDHPRKYPVQEVEYNPFNKRLFNNAGHFGHK